MPEEAAEELKQQEADGNAIKTAIEDCYKVYIGRVSMLKLAAVFFGDNFWRVDWQILTSSYSC